MAVNHHATDAPSRRYSVPFTVCVMPSTTMAICQCCTVPLLSVTAGVLGLIQWMRWSCHIAVPLFEMVLHDTSPVSSGTYANPNRFTFSFDVVDDVFSRTVPSAAISTYFSPLYPGTLTE